jgi:hypothetical protein
MQTITRIRGRDQRTGLPYLVLMEQNCGLISKHIDKFDILRELVSVQ